MKPVTSVNGLPVYVIAEMACSHEGDPALAARIIDAAGAAQAQAIQFQIWSLAAMVTQDHPDHAKLQRLEFSRAQWTDLAAHARKHFPQMHIVACVYESGSVDFCEELGVDAYKIHSSDLSNPTLVARVASTGKRIDLSTGASTGEEIQAAIAIIRATSRSPIWLMYGYQGFPTRLEENHLAYVATLQQRFGLPVGYQDHSDAEHPAALWLPAAALGMGVKILEKHLTHDRSRKGIDHEAALNPSEFAEFVRMVRAIEAALGTADPRPFSDEELKYRRYAKKSIVASRDLAKGACVGQEDVTFLRARELGLPPAHAPQIVGRPLKRAVSTHQLIREEDLE